ncbi:MAG: aminotransferase class I/II-fold pyridoxal phosphate-dependent enzyme [Christensenellales bacterium]|jgi:8-amino-7-oxononanoate synthase/acyl carrier protein
MFRLKEYVIDLAVDQTLRNMYEVSMKNGRNTVALEYVEDQEIKKITYVQLDAYVEGAACRLRGIIGEQANKFIGLKMKNSPKWIIAFWGILRSGNNPVLLDARANDAQIEHLLKQSGAVALLSDVGTEAIPDNVVRIHPDEICYYTDQAQGEEHWGDMLCLCTSGTTATSKVYAYDGQSFSQMFLGLRGLLKKTDRLSREHVMEKSLAFLPLHHIFGLVVVFLLTSLTGNTIVFPEDLVPEHILETCRKHRITQFVCVPIFWNGVAAGILKKAKLQGEATVKKLNKVIDWSIRIQKTFGRFGQKVITKLVMGKFQQKLFGTDMHSMVSGGGHVLPETLRIINGLGYYLVNGYGMTENGIIAVVNTERIEKRLNGSVGKALVPQHVKLGDAGSDGVGELLTRGRTMNIGQMIEGKLVPRDLNENKGWFKTGDVARCEKGNYYIEGRLKEVIINESGENVYPDELEDSFMDLPDVKLFTVMGIQNQLYEDITLVLEMEQGAKTDELTQLAQEIKLRNGALPLFKQVRSVLISLDPMPLANGIKVKRQAMKKAIEEKTWNSAKLDLNTGKTSGIQPEQKKQAVQENELTESVKKEIRSMFAEVLFMKEEEIDDDAHFIFDLGGDSLTSLSMFTRAEEQYGIMISDHEYYSCTNVNELAKLIVAKVTGGEVVLKQPEQTQKVRMARFEDTREYKEFKAREDSLMPMLTAYGNPYFEPHDSALRDVSTFRGKQVVNFASYNYLGFSGDPETNEAAIEAVKKYGCSASGSRLLAGEKPIHKELEAKLAEWKRTEDAIVMVGGHSTNVTVVGSFCNRNDLILYDALSHNSILQGCQLSLSESKAFPHNDYEALENTLKQVRDQYEKVLIIIEGVYSMDGDIAPVKEFVRIKKAYGCFLMVDEAHSSCVIGENGGGVNEYFDLEPDDIDIRMGTLSKGLGTCGGYIAGRAVMINHMRYNVPGFVFSVGMSPPLAAASIKAIEIMQRDNSRVKALHKNIAFFASEAKKRGLDICLAGESAIMPILIGADELAFKLSMVLQQEGVFVTPAVYPAVPRNKARLRFGLISEHKEEQITFALDSLEKHMREEGLLA